MARRYRHNKILCFTGEIATSYNDYLKTIHWKCKRAYIYMIRNKRCEKCNKPLTRYTVHHLTYKNIGNELDKDLMLLCEKCHNQIHYGNKSITVKKEVKKDNKKRIKKSKSYTNKGFTKNLNEKMIQTKDGKLEYANPKLNKTPLA